MIVFFCQAGADIIHILKEIETLNERIKQPRIKVICLNSFLFRSFSNIKLSDNVIIAYCRRVHPPMYTPWRKSAWLKIVETILSRHFDEDNISRVYFTSVNDDPIGITYVCWCLKKGYQMFYLNHYDEKQAISPVKCISIKDKIRLYLYKYFTGLDFSWYRMGGRWNILHFHIENYQVEELHPILDKTICKKFSYKICNDTKKNALVFSQPNREHELITDEEYNNLFHRLVEELKNAGYYVILKGHPILGICPTNTDQADEIIPQTLPSELIDLDVIDSCYGFLTIALSSSAKLGLLSYTILSLMNNKQSPNYYDSVNYVNETSEGKIKFLNSWKELYKQID